jgi:Fe-S-cluster containining protein
VATTDENGRATIAEPGYGRMPEELKREVEDYWEAIRNASSAFRAARGLPCLWLDLDVRLCRHYTYRPGLCREYRCSDGPDD